MKWRGNPAIVNGIGGEIIDDEDNIVAAMNVQVIQKLSEQKLNSLIALFRDSLRMRMSDMGKLK